VIKKLSSFYANRKFVTVFRITCLHAINSSPHLLTLFTIQFDIAFPSTSVSVSWSSPFGFFWLKYCIHFSPSRPALEPTQPPYRVFPGGKASGAWRWKPTPSSTEIKEKVKLYHYSPSGPSRLLVGQTLPLPLCAD